MDRWWTRASNILQSSLFNSVQWLIDMTISAACKRQEHNLEQAGDSAGGLLAEPVPEPRLRVTSPGSLASRLCHHSSLTVTNLHGSW